TGRYDDALESATDARHIAEAIYGDRHWRTAITMSAQGEALTGLGKFGEAEELLLGSYEILKADDGALPLFVDSTEQRLASLYDQWGKPPAELDITHR
ncbi:MAG: tetratricopeptide repeat protein, partial [Gammaproteobacteria bacterium]|nr:tetratricopeptide repeat protein [Gammaproteobacteria bacterium]